MHSSSSSFWASSQSWEFFPIRARDQADFVPFLSWMLSVLTVLAPDHAEKAAAAFTW